MQKADEALVSGITPDTPWNVSGSLTFLVPLWSVSCFPPWHVTQSTVPGGL